MNTFITSGSEWPFLAPLEPLQLVSQEGSHVGIVEAQSIELNIWHDLFVLDQTKCTITRSFTPMVNLAKFQSNHSRHKHSLCNHLVN